MPSLAKFQIDSPRAGVWFAAVDRELLKFIHDSDFKAIVSAQWCVTSEGDVESPVGFFSVVEIPAHDGERADMVAAVWPGDAPEHPLQPGWYVTRENDQGLIWVYRMLSKDDAMTAFRSMHREYALWVTEDEA